MPFKEMLPLSMVKFPTIPVSEPSSKVTLPEEVTGNGFANPETETRPIKVLLSVIVTLPFTVIFHGSSPCSTVIFPSLRVMTRPN